MLVAVAICGCSKVDEPDKVVTKFFDEMKSGNFTEAAKYVDAPFFTEMPDSENELLKHYFATMTVSTPVIIEQNDEKAVVAVDVEAVQLFDIIQNFIYEISMQMQDDPDLDLEAISAELDAKILDMVKSPDSPRGSLALEIELFKLGGGKKQWVISSTDALQAGLFLQVPEEPYDYGYEGSFDYEPLGTDEIKAKYIGGDDLSGLCSFAVEGELYHMYCDLTQFEDLEKNHKEKELTVTFQILGSPAQEAMGDTSGRLYMLEGYSK